MATFRASKRFHFSEDGTEPWAEFVRVPGSDPAVYEFETSDQKVIARLEDVDDVTRADDSKPARKPRKAAAQPDSGDGGGEVSPPEPEPGE